MCGEARHSIFADFHQLAHSDVLFERVIQVANQRICRDVGFNAYDRRISAQVAWYTLSCPLRRENMEPATFARIEAVDESDAVGLLNKLKRSAAGKGLGLPKLALLHLMKPG